MSSPIIPGAILALLAEVERTWTAHIEAHSDTSLRHAFPLGLKVESCGQHLATLYEEGWEFGAPEAIKERS